MTSTRRHPNILFHKTIKYPGRAHRPMPAITTRTTASSAEKHGGTQKRHRTRARITPALPLLALTICTFSGCTPDTPPAPEKPTVVPTAAITWQPGHEPTSELENNPWVKLARDSDIGEAMATNMSDFTINQITNYVSPGILYQAASLHDGLLDQDPMIYPGPAPWQPLRVEKSKSGVIIIACGTSSPWITTRDTPGGTVEPDSGRIGSINIILTTDHTKIADVSGSSILSENEGGGPCDSSTIPIALFTTPPPAPGSEPRPIVRYPLCGTRKECNNVDQKDYTTLSVPEKF